MPITLWSKHEWEQQTANKGIDNLAVSQALGAVYDAETIHTKFDALGFLLLRCREFIDKNKENIPLVKEAEKLKFLVFEFASAIVDAENESDLEKKIELRNVKKNSDPEYMPWRITSAGVHSMELPAQKTEPMAVRTLNTVQDWQKQELEKIKKAAIGFCNSSDLEERQEWNLNASVRMVETRLEKLIQPYIDQRNHGPKLPLSDSARVLMHLDSKTRHVVLVDAMKTISMSRKKMFARDYSPPASMTAERKSHIKSAIHLIGKNLIHKKIKVMRKMTDDSTNANIKAYAGEFEGTKYIYDPLQRENNRIFAAKGKLHTLKPEQNPIKLIRVSHEADFNRSANIGDYLLVLNTRKNSWSIYRVEDYDKNNIKTIKDIIDNNKFKEILPDAVPGYVNSNRTWDPAKIDPVLMLRLLQEYDEKIIGNKKITLDYYSGEKDMFTVTSKGDMFTEKGDIGKSHHSSSVAGKALVFPGNISSKEGVITYLDNQSGHYKPDEGQTIQILGLLRRAGLITSAFNMKVINEQSSKEVVNIKHFFPIPQETKHEILKVLKESIKKETGGFSNLFRNKKTTVQIYEMMQVIEKTIARKDDYYNLVNVINSFKDSNQKMQLKPVVACLDKLLIILDKVNVPEETKSSIMKNKAGKS